MRLLRFVARQVRFLVVGSRSSAVATAQLQDQISGLANSLERLNSEVESLHRLADTVLRLDRQMDSLAAHADNVTDHLRQLSEQFNSLDSKVSSVAAVEAAHQSDIKAMRSMLRLAVDDLGDRVTQLTVRLNEL